MKNLVRSILLNVVAIILPLVGTPSLIFNPKIILIVIGSTSIWLTQPVFSIEETKKNRSTDKFSVLIILIMSYISLLVPIICWVLFNNDKSDFSFVSVIGVLFLITGIALRAWSVRTLGNFFTPTVQIQEKHKLITSGPYKFVRHPSYTGAFLAIISFAFILNSIPGIIISFIAMCVAYSIRTNIEEKELISFFGAEYIEYSKKTNKLFPFIW